LRFNCRAGGTTPERKGGCDVTTIERTTTRVAVRSGPTNLTLNKEAGTVTMTRKLLLWSKKPSERPLSDIVGVNVDRNVDRASGVELCCVVLIMRDGSAWSLPYTDNEDATDTAAAIGDFLGLPKS
jgi:hypothetical protein